MQARAEEKGKHGFLNVQFKTGSFMTANCSSEASAPSYSQSTSSTVISPASLDVSEAPCESSAQSGIPSLKEQDYIGMADMLSTASMNLSEYTLSMHQVNQDHEEPDLRLGLGPSLSKGVGDIAGLHLFSQSNGKDVKESPSISHTRADVPDSKQAVFDAAHAHPYPNSSDAFAMSTLKRLDALPIQSSFCPISADSPAKSAKRLFSDTVSQAPPDVGISAYVNTGTGVQEVKAGAMYGPGAVRMIMQRADLNSKSLSSKQAQMLYWSTPRAPSWPSEFAQSTSSHDQLSRNHSDNPLALKSMLERTSPSGSVVVNNLDIASDEAPPAKEQVIGWPPVRSYRRSAINSGQSRPAGTESDVQAAMYVKVNMDGIPIGRKVDLNAYSSYDELLSALERLFYSPPVGEGVRFLRARDFVLTYEDKEGDWMLVGDVPWGMFINTVKRLRITRGSESTCLGSSTSKNFS